MALQAFISLFDLPYPTHHIHTHIIPSSLAASQVCVLFCLPSLPPNTLTPFSVSVPLHCRLSPLLLLTHTPYCTHPSAAASTLYLHYPLPPPPLHSTLPSPCPHPLPYSLLLPFLLPGQYGHTPFAVCWFTACCTYYHLPYHLLSIAGGSHFLSILFVCLQGFSPPTNLLFVGLLDISLHRHFQDRKVDRTG